MPVYLHVRLVLQNKQHFVYIIIFLFFLLLLFCFVLLYPFFRITVHFSSRELCSNRKCLATDSIKNDYSGKYVTR